MIKILQHFEHLLERKHLNVFWTLYMNFRYFPLFQAIHVPIKCYGKIRVRSTEGRIIISSDIVKSGIILIGVDPTGYRTCGTTTLTLLKGSTWEVKGNISVYQGASVLVGRNARFVTDDKVTIGDNAEIICMDNIQIGEHSDITWDCQITDFASHPMRDIKSDEMHFMTKPVKIGSYCWIGNRTTIMPGTILPERIIVSSNSLLNKNYIDKGIVPFSLIGGVPAVLLKHNIERIYNI